VNVTAIRTLTGDYGTIHAGQQFRVSDQDAESLASRGLIEYSRTPDPVSEQFDFLGRSAGRLRSLKRRLRS
jgi:hypothetical protein